MMGKLSSKERILKAIKHEPVDHLPLCFDGICHGRVQFLNDLYPDPFKRASVFMDLELDTGILLDFPGDYVLPSTNTIESIEIKEWQEDIAGEQWPVMFKEYITPKGNLRQVVRRTEDYYLKNIWLLSDLNVPASRSIEYLVNKEEDLEKLEYILRVPKGKELDKFNEKAKEVKKFCNKNQIIMSGYLIGTGDPLCWLSGVENTLITAQENPDFLKRYTKIIARWDIDIMNILINAGIDLIVRRGWYESTDFWSPQLYRDFLFEPLKKEIELAHQSGVKFTYVMNSGAMPLLGIFKELGFDIWSNIEPTQEDLSKIKSEIGNQITLCGGVNNFSVLEKGTEEDVRKAVIDTVEKLSPGNGFILAPSDSILNTEKIAKRNFYKMIEVWKEIR